MYKQDQFIQRRQAIARALITTATLLLSLASTNQLALATGNYRLQIITPPDPICAHQSYPIRVSVLNTSSYRRDKKLITFNGKPELAFALGAVVKNSTIGTLSPLKRVSGFATLSDEVPGEETFTFSANKAGTTEMYFDAQLRDEYAESTVPITVHDCDFEVSVQSNWFVSQGTGGSIGLEAILYKARLEADEKGHYTGSAMLFWIPNIVLPAGCVHEDTIGQSKVNMTGDIKEIRKKNYLVVEITFDATALHEVGGCPKQGHKIDTKNPLKPNSLKVTVPISGGTIPKSHILKAAGISLTSSTNVHVYPVQ